VHVSKVRSLTLDRLDPPCFTIIEQLGNDVVNATYEAEIAQGWVKPDVTTSRSDREKWIRVKYEQRGFVPDETLPVAALGDVMCKVRWLCYASVTLRLVWGERLTD
jgi:Putative GTPase activating protein for Arf